MPLSEMPGEWRSLLEFLTLIFAVTDTIFLLISIVYRASKLFHFVFSIILLIDLCILTIFSIFRHSDIDVIKSDFLYNLSAISVTALSFVLMMTAASLFIANMKLWRSNISYMSIKETYDWLPDGVCIYDINGNPLLMNTRMDYLSMILTGELLLNASEFYERLRAGDILQQNTVLNIGLESGIVIRISDNKIYRFSHKIMNIDKKSVGELRAVDITNEILLNEELIAQRANLTKLNRHLQEYSDSVTDYTREQEQLKSKELWISELKRLIGDTGNLIDIGALDKDSGIYMRWQKMFDLIQTDFDLKKRNEPLADLLEAAKIANLNIIIDGDIPVNNRNAMRLLVSGMRECLMDAMASKNASTVFLRIADEDFNIKMDISNDKTQATENEDEGGGLARIASIAKQTGGDVKIVINPIFKLEISVPQRGDDFYDSSSYC